uniref:Uncharacterized protein n=1 Tax=Cacopsylla melanoneura TaxID=428564 RepID=A0A8D8XFT4_9HEMI
MLALCWFFTLYQDPPVVARWLLALISTIIFVFIIIVLRSVKCILCQRCVALIFILHLIECTSLHTFFYTAPICVDKFGFRSSWLLKAIILFVFSTNACYKDCSSDYSVLTKEACSKDQKIRTRMNL